MTIHKKPHYKFKSKSPIAAANMHSSLEGSVVKKKIIIKEEVTLVVLKRVCPADTLKSALYSGFPLRQLMNLNIYSHF